jgi:hypothetical protein
LKFKNTKFVFSNPPICYVPFKIIIESKSNNDSIKFNNNFKIQLTFEITKKKKKKKKKNSCLFMALIL